MCLLSYAWLGICCNATVVVPDDQTQSVHTGDLLNEHTGLHRQEAEQAAGRTAEIPVDVAIRACAHTPAIHPLRTGQAIDLSNVAAPKGAFDGMLHDDIAGSPLTKLFIVCNLPRYQRSSCVYAKETGQNSV